ncbi:hypothetical protein P3T27_002425 [Kitasatospora sp. MAA19]|uniref:hypothetical protein n=1 Tax=Kitasatospora sp. MAA19 TaxID=3035090 RepID=UPI0024749CED|nr:hypothetical protein [Kitasatospora sp. MAA19]MDH6705703.1 hypothetical protein [Kitasatospora sp. MAA19]
MVPVATAVAAVVGVVTTAGQGDLVHDNGNGSRRDVTVSSGRWGQSLSWRICRSGGGGCSPWLCETA